MDIKEMLRTLGALYLSLYIQAELLQRENAEFRSQIEKLQKTQTELSE